MKRRRVNVPPEFVQVLRDAGWLIKTTPDPMLVVLGFDEYVFVERNDRLVHLHIAGVADWEAKRYTREPFGDYTVCYQPLGKGVGLESLRKFLEGR